MTDDERERALSEARATLERVGKIEPREYEPAPKPVGSSGMENSNPRGRTYRAAPKNQPGATVEPDWSGWEAWLRARLDSERRDISEIIIAASGDAQKLARQMRQELETELVKLRAEVSELRDSVRDLQRQRDVVKATCDLLRRQLNDGLSARAQEVSALQQQINSTRHITDRVAANIFGRENGWHHHD
jgi:hypothetical protein